MGYPTHHQRPDSAVVATLAVRFPAVFAPNTWHQVRVIFDVGSSQAHIFVEFGLTIALETTSAWYRLSNAISTTEFGGRGDAQCPFSDHFQPNNEAENSAFSDVFQRFRQL